MRRIRHDGRIAERRRQIIVQRHRRQTAVPRRPRTTGVRAIARCTVRTRERNDVTAPIRLEGLLRTVVEIRRIRSLACVVEHITFRVRVDIFLPLAGMVLDGREDGVPRLITNLRRLVRRLKVGRMVERRRHITTHDVIRTENLVVATGRCTVLQRNRPAITITRIRHRRVRAVNRTSDSTDTGRPTSIDNTGRGVRGIDRNRHAARQRQMPIRCPRLKIHQG